MKTLAPFSGETCVWCGRLLLVEDRGTLCRLCRRAATKEFIDAAAAVWQIEQSKQKAAPDRGGNQR